MWLQSNTNVKWWWHVKWSYLTLSDLEGHANLPIYRVVQKKLHRVLCSVILQPFATKSRGLQNSLSANQCTIFFIGLNILWQTAGIGYMSLVMSPACKHGTSHRWRSVVVPDLIEPPNWPSNSPGLNHMDNMGCSSQLAYRQEIKDTDHLKQVLNSCWHMLLLTSGLKDCCWSFVQGHPRWASFSLV